MAGTNLCKEVGQQLNNNNMKFKKIQKHLPEGAKLKKSLFKDFAKAAEKREETPAQVFSCEIFRNFFLEHLQATVSEIFLYDINGELHGKVATVLNLAKMTSQRTGKNSQARVTFDLEKDYDV